MCNVNVETINSIQQNQQRRKQKITEKKSQQQTNIVVIDIYIYLIDIVHCHSFLNIFAVNYRDYIQHFVIEMMCDNLHHTNLGYCAINLFTSLL